MELVSGREEAGYRRKASITEFSSGQEAPCSVKNLFYYRHPRVKKLLLIPSRTSSTTSSPGLRRVRSIFDFAWSSSRCVGIDFSIFFTPLGALLPPKHVGSRRNIFVPPLCRESSAADVMLRSSLHICPSSAPTPAPLPGHGTPGPSAPRRAAAASIWYKSI